MDAPPPEAAGSDVVDIADLDDAAFEQVYDLVLAPSFPPTELLGREVLRALYLGGNPDFFGYTVLRGHRPIAAALCEHHRPSRISLLDNLAVAPDIRQGGHGGRLMRHLLSRWESADSVAFLAEVEDPRHHSGGEHGDPAARLRFYDRHGAQLLPLPYFQPSLGPGLDRVPNLLLLALRTRDSGLPSAALGAFLDDNITACEGDTARDTDPDYRSLRDRVTAWPPTAPLWPLSRLADLPE